MMTTPGPNSFLRDFYFELFKDSDNLRELYQLEREIWFRQLDLNRKEEHLFELEMYLRAIGCFFNLHNQFPENRDQAITREFADELKVLAAALERGIALSQLLLDRGLVSSLNFQSYLENQVAPDYLRLQILRRTLDQKRPEESLFLINRCFRDLKKVLDHLLKRPPCTYQLFFHFGQVVPREIAFNRFFNPLLILEFRPEYDRIRSVAILDAIRGIESGAERRAASKTFLALFRLLHYLRYIPRRGKARILRRSLILFTLFYSEASTLSGFLRILADQPERVSAELSEAASEVSQQLRAQLRSMFGGERVALDVERSRLVGDKNRSVASSRDLLDTFLKDCITRMLQVYRPDQDDAGLFDSARNQQEQSIRLRADLWLFRQLLGRSLSDSAKRKRGRLEVPASLERFSDYFMQTSYNFLRYGDGGPFERYHAILLEGIERGGAMACGARFMEDTDRFHEYVSETYDLVCRRTELIDCQLEIEALEDRLGRWVKHEDS
jgi:hypothetical protein